MSQLLKIAQSKNSAPASLWRVCLAVACAIGIAMFTGNALACQVGGSFQPVNSAPDIQTEHGQARPYSTRLVPIDPVQGVAQSPPQRPIQDTAPNGFQNPSHAQTEAPPGWQPPSMPEREFPKTEFTGWPQSESPAGPTPVDPPVHIDRSVQPASVEIELPRTGTTLPPPRLVSNQSPGTFSSNAPARVHSTPQNGMPPLDTFTAPNSNVGMTIGGGQSLIDGTSIDDTASPAATTMERASRWFEKAKSTVGGWVSGDSATGGMKEKFGGADVSRIFGSLAVVLGGYFGFVWLMRMFNPGRPRGLPAEVVDVVGQIPFGQGEILQLVRLGSKLVLLNNGPAGLSPLGEITDPAEVDYLASLCDSGSRSRNNRRNSRRTSTRRSRSEQRPESQETESGTFRNLMGRFQSAEPAGNAARQIIAGLAGATSGDVVHNNVTTGNTNPGNTNPGNTNSGNANVNHANLNNANVNNGLNQGADLDRLVQSLSQAIREQGSVYEA